MDKTYLYLYILYTGIQIAFLDRAAPPCLDLILYICLHLIVLLIAKHFLAC